MEPARFDDFLKLANGFYSSIGLQPYEKKGTTSFIRTLISLVLFYFGIINLNVMLACEIIYVALAFYKGENILEAIMTMSYIGFVSVGIFKMMFVWRQKAALTRIVEQFQNIFPQDLQLQEQYNLRYYLRQCTTVTIGFSLLYMILIWTYNLFAISQYIVYDQLLAIRKVQQELPYTMYYLWEWRDNWSYYLMYFLQSVAGYASAAGQISSDLMLCAFATQLVMHFDYVSLTVANYEVKRESPDKEADNAKNIRFLSQMIEYHDTLLNLSDEMNNIFGLPLLLNFATSSSIICFVGFQMTIGASLDTLFKLLLFLVSSIAQVYLICHYGQQLIDAVIDLGLNSENYT